MSRLARLRNYMTAQHIDVAVFVPGSNLQSTIGILLNR